MVAIVLSSLTTSTFAFDRPHGAPPEMSKIDRPIPFKMRRPNPVLRVLESMELTSDQKSALNLLKAKFRKEMDSLKSTQLTKEEEIINALEENRFDIEKFSQILQQKCAKESALKASHIKEIVALLTVEQITALKQQLKSKPDDDLGY